MNALWLAEITIRQGRRRFQPPPQPKRFSFADAKVQLYESPKRNVASYCGDSKYLDSAGVFHKGETISHFCNPVICDNMSAACIPPQFQRLVL
jgi:hypothetical protein